MKMAGNIAISLFISLFLLQTAIAQTQKTPEELAKETEEACAATASTKSSPDKIEELVNKACALLEKEGKAAFPKFRGKDSEFIYAGNYIFVQNTSGVMMMHPIKFKMEGQNLIDMKDVNGKPFVMEMSKLALEKGSGWMEYMWPKPGSKEQSRKISYVKLCNVDGEKAAVGFGVWDMTDEEAQKVLK